MTAPSMINGKTRRPIGMREDVPAYDPATDPYPSGNPDGGTMARVAFFDYREDAVAAAREWLSVSGWDWRPQYFGRYDRWALVARRKSWSSSRSILVEGCRP